MKSSFSRKSVSGASTWPSSISRAFALGPPLLAVKAVAGEEHGQPHRRLAGGAGRLAARRPRRDSDSSHGRAIVTPTPRRNVRREN